MNLELKPKTDRLPILSAATVVALLAFTKLSLQLATASKYGIFRDELYYLACADHLSWGYVDHPPLIAFVTWFSAHLFGTSLIGLRLLPAIAGGLLVWVTAAIAKELGGNRFAQCVAALAILPVPIYLMLSHWLTMNAFEPLLWMSALWLSLRMLSRSEPRYWLLIGAVCGVGLENKYTMLLLAAALVIGLWVTPQRQILRSKWFAAGVVMAFLLFLPNLLWLIHHDFPFLEFERQSRLSTSRIERAPLSFIADQVLMMNPLEAPLWLGGLAWLLLSKNASKYRFLGWTFMTVFAALLILRAKNYYVAPAYPVLFAAGSVAFEQAAGFSAPWVRALYLGLMLAAGLMLAPFALPLLSVNDFVAYQRNFGGFTPIRLEKSPQSLLPQQFADEFGWEEMVRKTSLVFNALPAAEKKDTAIFGNNYGEAAAIDFFGAKYGNHESYWLWGPRDYSGKTVIVLGSDGSGDRAHFRTVQTLARVGDPYVRPSEQFNLYLCRDLVTDLHAFWPTIRHW